jgi:gluconolactonase
MSKTTTQNLRTSLSAGLRSGLTLGAFALAISAAACGDDDDNGSSGSGGSAGKAGTAGSVSGAGGSSGTGGSGGTGGSSGASGTGGGAGAININPIAGASQPQEIVKGRVFTEGPLWLNTTSTLLFTDVADNKVYSWTEGSTDPAVYLAAADNNNSNGLALMPDGRLARCEHATHQVVVHAADNPKAVTIVAADFNDGGVKRLNSPNDVIVSKAGTIYFTDPTFGLPQGTDSVLGYQGVYRAVPNGNAFTVTAEDKSLQQPNGIALSPDEKIAYVADTTGSLVQKYTVGANGALTGGTKLTDTGGGGDGLTVDDAGNIYVAVNAGVRVFAPDSTAWGTLEFPQQPSNVAFGGADRKTLFVTARTSVYRVTLVSATGAP